MSDETQTTTEEQTTDASATPEAPPADTLDAAVERIFGKPDAPAKVEEPPEETEQKPAPEPEPSKPEPKEERVAARIAAAKRAELRAAEARAELRRTQEQIDAKQRELDAREAKLKLIEEDPVRFFEEYKSDPESFLKKLAGVSAPEAVADKRIAKLEEELRAEREERIRTQTEIERARAALEAESTWKAASAAFVDHVAVSADKYPHLVEEYTDAEAVNEAFAVLREVVGHDAHGRPVTAAEAYKAQHGVWPDNEVVAEYLDQRAKARIEARQKSAWRKRGEPAAIPGQGRPVGDLNPVPPVKGTSPRTLTSRAASEKASAPKPWSQEDADAQSIRILQEAMSKAG